MPNTNMTISVEEAQADWLRAQKDGPSATIRALIRAQMLTGKGNKKDMGAVIDELQKEEIDDDLVAEFNKMRPRRDEEINDALAQLGHKRPYFWLIDRDWTMKMARFAKEKGWI